MCVLQCFAQSSHLLSCFLWIIAMKLTVYLLDSCMDTRRWDTCAAAVAKHCGSNVTVAWVPGSFIEMCADPSVVTVYPDDTHWCVVANIAETID